MAYYPANVVATSLTAGVSGVTTDLIVVDGAGYPDPTAPGKAPYKVLVGYGTSREEVCLVTSKPAADTLRVTRGYDSSAATAKNAGDVVVPGVNAADFTYFQQVAADAAAHADTVSAAASAHADSVSADARAYADTLAGGLQHRNLVVNGDFSVIQRGAVGLTTTAAGTLVDCWYTQTGASGTVTHGMAATLSALPVQELTACGLWQLSGQSGAGSEVTSFTKIEAVHTLAGRSGVLTFYAKASAGTPKLGVGMRQYFGSGGTASVTAVSQVVVLSTAWTRYTVPVTFASVVGKSPIGPGDGIILTFTFSSGTTMPTVGVQNADFSISGVQLEGGTVATPFDVQRPGESLRRSRRYFQRNVRPPLRGVVGSAGNVVRMGMSLVPPMVSLQDITANALVVTDGVDTRTTSTVASYAYATDWIELTLTVSPPFTTPGRAVAVAGTTTPPTNSIDLTGAF